MPSVSDAFRINKLPEINDSYYQSQQILDYHIFSVPVASTFSPDKGNPQKIKRISLKTPPSNYLSLAAGNYFNIQAKGFLDSKLIKQVIFIQLLIIIHLLVVLKMSNLKIVIQIQILV